MVIHQALPVAIAHATTKKSVASSVGPKTMEASGETLPSLDTSCVSSTSPARHGTPTRTQSGQRRPGRPTNARARSDVSKASSTSPTWAVLYQTQSHHLPVNSNANVPRATIHSNANDRTIVSSL